MRLLVASKVCTFIDGRQFCGAITENNVKTAQSMQDKKQTPVQAPAQFQAATSSHPEQGHLTEEEKARDS